MPPTVRLPDRFQRIRYWGTFTAAEFADHDVSSSSHPRFADLCAVLRDPRLADPQVDLGNLASLVRLLPTDP